jgi:energy-coupling factor transporter ATP-binding protein EcfA2
VVTSVNELLQRQLTARIDGDSRLSTEVGILVLAATDGEAALTRALGGEAAEGTRLVDFLSEAAQSPVGAYLGPLTVEGFRGIGPRASLPLQPGPGLTLVIGRNGSGKSSFAEAVEMLLTGDNQRWAERHAIWREGWRNLHHPSTAEITVELAIAGRTGKTIARRAWPAGATLDASVTQLQSHGQPKTDLSSLGWKGALAVFRPFLSYNELGSMFDEGPSHLYDALSSVLGLEDLSRVERVLGEARKAREKAYKDAKQDLVPVLARLEQLDDVRAGECHRALAGPRWDFDMVESIVLGRAGSRNIEGDLGLLHGLSALQPPDPERVEAVVGSLRHAAAAVARTVGTNAERALKVATVLQEALDLHASHGQGDCPVCGRRGALDADWRTSAERHAAELGDAARAATDAIRLREDAMRSARELLSAPPPILEQAGRVGIDAFLATAAWRKWAAGSALGGPETVADYIERELSELAAAINNLRKTARAELDRRESEWRPVARDLLEWLSDARAAQEGNDRIRALKAAEAWMKKTSIDLRNERFQPIADEARRIWDILKLQSNVELGRPELDGTGTRRRVRLDVTVDGVAGAALGVMSQGELHSLALSLFLPRATLPDSPFRFLVIDDPVQSMDPSRVDGLARLLQEVGNRRQVVVFTHDDRLPEAVRRLGIDARVLEVARQPGSAVNIVQALTPVERNIEDARAIASDTDLPPEVARRVVPGFCRAAVEAACVEAVRRRRLGRGEDHAAVEDLLAQLSTRKLVALTLFDNPERTGDITSRLSRYGPWAGPALRAVNEGAHGLYSGDLKRLIRDAANFSSWLRQEK